MDIKKPEPMMDFERLVNSTFLQMSGQSEEFFARIDWVKVDGVYRRVQKPYPSNYLREQLAYYKAILLHNTKDDVALAFYESFKLKFEKVDERKTEFLNSFKIPQDESLFYIINCGLRPDLLDISSAGLYKIDVGACLEVA